MKPEALTALVIDPIIAWTAEKRGRKTALVAACQRVVPGATRQLVESWINPNPDRRGQPNLGNGLMIMQAAITLGVYSNGELLALLQPTTPPTT